MELISIILIVASILLVGIVLIQNPKGGGIAANFNFPQQIMGVKRSSDFVERATWGLALLLLVASITFNLITKDEGGISNESKLKDNLGVPMQQQVKTDSAKK